MDKSCFPPVHLKPTPPLADPPLPPPPAPPTFHPMPTYVHRWGEILDPWSLSWELCRILGHPSLMRLLKFSVGFVKPLPTWTSRLWDLSPVCTVTLTCPMMSARVSSAIASLILDGLSLTAPKRSTSCISMIATWAPVSTSHVISLALLLMTVSSWSSGSQIYSTKICQCLGQQLHLVVVLSLLLLYLVLVSGLLLLHLLLH